MMERRGDPATGDGTTASETVVAVAARAHHRRRARGGGLIAMGGGLRGSPGGLTRQSVVLQQAHGRDGAAAVADKDRVRSRTALVEEERQPLLALGDARGRHVGRDDGREEASGGQRLAIAARTHRRARKQ